MIGQRCLRVLLVGLLVLASGCDRGTSGEKPGENPGGGAGSETSEALGPLEPDAKTEFEGEGNETTEQFEVGDNWELHWSFDGGSRFQVELVRADGDSPGKIVDQKTKGSGVTSVVSGGEYSLKIRSDGDWTLKVFERK